MATRTGRRFAGRVPTFLPTWWKERNRPLGPLTSRRIASVSALIIRSLRTPESRSASWQCLIVRPACQMTSARCARRGPLVSRSRSNTKIRRSTATPTTHTHVRVCTFPHTSVVETTHGKTRTNCSRQKWTASGWKRNRTYCYSPEGRRLGERSLQRGRRGKGRSMRHFIGRPM